MKAYKLEEKEIKVSNFGDHFWNVSVGNAIVFTIHKSVEDKFTLFYKDCHINTYDTFKEAKYYGIKHAQKTVDTFLTSFETYFNVMVFEED